MILAFLLSASNAVMCPDRIFPLVVGADNGDTVYLTLCTTGSKFFAAGYSTSSVYKDPTQSKSAIYHVFNYENYEWLDQKYYITTLFDEIHYISATDSIFYGVTEHPGYIMASNGYSGNFNFYAIKDGGSQINLSISRSSQHVSHDGRLYMFGTLDDDPDNPFMMIYDHSSPSFKCMSVIGESGTEDLIIQGSIPATAVNNMVVALRYKRDNSYYHTIVAISVFN